MVKRFYSWIPIMVCGWAGSGDAQAWEPGVYSIPMATRGFTVDPSSRNDVISFWHAVYMASEGYQDRVKWTGDYAGTNGTTAPVFVGDVERRLNYFRAMCGVHSNAMVNTDAPVVIDPADRYRPEFVCKKSTAAQAGALMMVRTYLEQRSFGAINHDPPPTVAGWSGMAWNGNAHGNLAFGVYGPSAINQYLLEESPRDVQSTEWNVLVGHRRWCLYPKSTDFATGDQPGRYVPGGELVPPTNVFYVSQATGEFRTQPSTNFVTYPPGGYFPAPLNSPFWSVSYPGADFSKAVVSVKDASGKVLPISDLRYNSNFGDPALIWRMPDEASVKSVYDDLSFTVQVSGIGGLSVPVSHTYKVTLIHPDRLTSSHKITGSTDAVAGQSTKFTFTPPSGTESILIGVSKYQPAVWSETAENGDTGAFIKRAVGSYALSCKMAQYEGFGVIEGLSSFRLTFPVNYDLNLKGVPEQIIELDREIIPGKDAALTFKYKRGLMSTQTSLDVEATQDGGVSWKRVSSITGLSDTNYVPTVFTKKIALAKSAVPMRFRFRLKSIGGLVFSHQGLEKLPTGIFFDAITTTGCEWLNPKKQNSFSKSTKTFTLNNNTAGFKMSAGDNVSIRMRVKLGGRWFPYGDVKKVSVVKN